MPITSGKEGVTHEPKSKSAMLVRALLAQGLILSVSGGLLLQDYRGTVVHEMERLVERNNDSIPALIREEVPDLCGAMFAAGDSRLQRLLSQAHLDPGAAAWVVDDQGRVVWASREGHPPGPNGSDRAAPPTRAMGTGEESDVEARRGAVNATGNFSTRHSLPNGFHLVVEQAAPEGMLSARASFLGAYLRTVVAGAATLGLTVLVTLLIMRRYESQIERNNAQLEEEVRRQVQASTQRLHAIIFGLAKLADFRDSDTGDHLDRICAYSASLARELAPENPEITRAWIEHLKLAASLHDIGKVGVPDAVLLKPGGLTQEERQVIEQHPIFGADTLMAVRRRLGDSPLLDLSIEIALQHHERWDGSGYPFGLGGEQISLSARIVAVADVYDALRSARVYKPAWTHDQAVRAVCEGSGSQFDPAVVRAFLRIETEFAAIAERWASDRAGPPAIVREAA